MSPIISGGGTGGGGGGLGSPILIYRYTVTGADKASIDTGVDTPDAGSNNWTSCDLLEFWLYARTDEASIGSEVAWTFNNNTGANYDWQWWRNLNTTGAGFIGNAQTKIDTNVIGASVADASAFAIVALTMQNPTGTTGYKSVSGTGSCQVPGDVTNSDHFLYAGQFRSASAMTRLAITPVTGGKKLKVGSQLLIYKRPSS